MSKRLKESSSLSAGSGKWHIQLLSEGVGSSGAYSGEMLERDGATAFPAGTHIYLDHLSESEEYDRSGNHSIKDLVGVTLAEAKWDAETKSLRSEAKWFNGYHTFIEEAKDYIGLSIEAAGELKDGVVESLHYSPSNAIAVVPRGGRDGKVLSLIESWRDSSGNIDLNENDEGKRAVPVTPEEIKQIGEALAEALKPSLTAIQEAINPTPVGEPVEEAEVDKVDGAEVVEAAFEAGLSKTARARVVAAVNAGETVEKAIEAEKALRDEIIKEADVAPVVGRVRESGSDSETYTVSGWSK